MKKVIEVFKANDVWAAACAAHRVNNGYINAYDYESKVTPNRDLVHKFLKDTTNILDQDRVEAEKIHKYYKGLTFKILQGKKLSDFEQKVSEICELEEIKSNYDIAVLASLPHSYLKALERDAVQRKIENASGGFIGNIGDKVSIDVEVLKCNYSKNWNVYFVQGLTKDDQAVFFAYKQEIAKGTKINVTGRVKSHRDFATQLNRVRVK